MLHSPGKFGRLLLVATSLLLGGCVGGGASYGTALRQSLPPQEAVAPVPVRTAAPEEAPPSAPAPVAAASAAPAPAPAPIPAGEGEGEPVAMMMGAAAEGAAGAGEGGGGAAAAGAGAAAGAAGAAGASSAPPIPEGEGIPPTTTIIQASEDGATAQRSRRRTRVRLTFSLTVVPAPPPVPLPPPSAPVIPDPTPAFRAAADLNTLAAAAAAPRVLGGQHDILLGVNEAASITIHRGSGSNLNEIHSGSTLLHGLANTLNAAATFTVAGGSGAATTLTVTAFQNFPADVRTVETLTQSGANKEFNLIGKRGGGLGLAVLLHNYNRADYEVDLSPAQAVVHLAAAGSSLSVALTSKASVAVISVNANTFYMLMESDFAAYGLRLNNTAFFFRYGREAAPAQLASFAGGKLHAQYHIARHAAKGFYHNALKTQGDRFLSNKRAGTLAVDFGAGRATLNLTVHAYDNTVFGPSLLASAAHIGEDFVAFNNFALAGFNSTTGVGNLACASAGGTGDESTDATDCGGRVVINGVTHRNNAAIAGGALSINARFYGAQAQEVAGMMQYEHAAGAGASEISDRVYLAFLGAHAQGGVNAGAITIGSGGVRYKVRTWDSAGNGTVHGAVRTNAGGAPVEYISTTEVTYAFGAADATAYALRFFRGTLSTVPRGDAAGGVRISNAITMSVAHAITVIGISPHTTSMRARTYQAGGVGIFAALNYAVEAEHAAFFYIMKDRDIRKAQHGFYGAQAPARVLAALDAAGVKGVYQIPPARRRASCGTARRMRTTFCTIKTPARWGRTSARAR